MYRYVTLVAAVAIGSSDHSNSDIDSGNHSFNNGISSSVYVHTTQQSVTEKYLNEVVYISLLVEDLWSDMRHHVLSISEGVSKYHILRSDLLKKATGDTGRSSGVGYRPETSNVKQMLRTAIMAR